MEDWVWKDCPASEKCGCQEHISPDDWNVPPRSQDMPTFKCLDTTCGTSYSGTCPFNSGAEGCPVKECNPNPYQDFNGRSQGSQSSNPCEPGNEGLNMAKCRVKAIFPQRFYTSPNYRKYTSATALNSAIWNAQSDQNEFLSEQKIEFSGSQTVQAKDASDSRFPGVALQFQDPLAVSAAAGDANKLSLNVIIQSWFSQTGNARRADYGLVRTQAELSKAETCFRVNRPPGSPAEDRVNYKGFTQSFSEIGQGGWNVPYQVDGINILLSQLTSATLKSASGNSASSITGSFGSLPYPNENSQQLLAMVASVQGILGNIFIAGAMTMLLPAFLVSIVQERELRLKAMMRMNGGLSDSVYWAVTIGWTYVFHLATNLWLWIVCMIMVAAYPNGPALGKSEGGLMFVFFLLWTLCQISFTVCWSSLYTRYKRTSLHAYGFQLLLMIGVLVLNMVAYPTSPLPSALFLIPHVAFYRALYLFHQRAYFFALMLPGDEVGTILGYLVLDIFLYAILAAYLQNVMKSEVSAA